MIGHRQPRSTDTELKTRITAKDGQGTEWPIVLFRDEDGAYWYQLPVVTNDPATSTLFGEFTYRRDATTDAKKHLRDLV